MIVIRLVDGVLASVSRWEISMYQRSSGLIWLPGVYEGWRYRINEVVVLDRYWYVIRGVFKDDTFKPNRRSWKREVPYDLCVRIDVPVRDLRLKVWLRSRGLGQ
jgi:hypothetical protein